MESLKKIDFINVIIVFSVLVVIGLAAYLGNLMIKSGMIIVPKISVGGDSIVTDNTINLDAIYMAGPMLSISSAEIVEINDGVVVVEVKLRDTLEFKNKTLNFEIKTNEQTIYLKPPLFVPYLFRPSPLLDSDALSGIGLTDFAIGEIVDISLLSDLRFTNKDDLVASVVSKKTGNNVISGEVLEAGQYQLVVEGMAPLAGDESAGVVRENMRYVVNVGSDTEIATFGVSGPEKIGLLDIPLNYKVVIYSSSELIGSVIDAALVYALPPVTAVSEVAVAEPDTSGDLAPEVDMSE